MLVVHGNYLSDEDIQFLAAHRDHMSVVYCPRTHAYFGHAPHPLPRLLAAGITVALGTDSRASNPDLSLLGEMRYIARHVPGISPADVLSLGTSQGMRALGLEGSGDLSVGSRADFAVIALPDDGAEDALADPHEAIFASDLPTIATYVAGERCE